MLMIDIILFLLFWICISILYFYCVLGWLKSNHLFQLEKCMNNVKYIDILPRFNKNAHDFNRGMNCCK